MRVRRSSDCRVDTPSFRAGRKHPSPFPFRIRVRGRSGCPPAVAGRTVKRGYKYRFYPTNVQAARPARSAAQTAT
ncbi:MAG TPA: helix-turn-helix domain-containing protein [Nocardiopsis listeri]|nr:helix-turn-helix domain-containing protein [Nocardiopsis listeri]